MRRATPTSRWSNSGHGLEMGGANYLVPVDATLATEDDVADETVTLDRVMKALDDAKRLKLVILDACRTNPFLASMTVKGGQKAIEKGLAPDRAPGTGHTDRLRGEGRDPGRGW